MNAHSIARIAQLAPQVQDKANTMAQMLTQAGIDVEVTQGLRTMAEQRAYYAQGREPVNQVNALRFAVGLAPIMEAENTVVTQAAPGESYHEYGLCLDVAPFDLQGRPDWNVAHPSWAKIIAVGESVGFTSGSCWPGKKQDDPHFQYTGRFPVSPDGEVWRLWQQGGLPAVWQAAYEGQT